MPRQHLPFLQKVLILRAFSRVLKPVCARFMPLKFKTRRAIASSFGMGKGPENGRKQKKVYENSNSILAMEGYIAEMLFCLNE